MNPIPLSPDRTVAVYFFAYLATESLAVSGLREFPQSFFIPSCRAIAVTSLSLISL